ncbi:hypothetical protein, partial [Phocaeicola vulgatus]|uniref:hypothetical protein n=1 Tax=Phocaeicola vulgatus TaxID=821 RepID=UPI001C6FDEDF
KFSIELKNFPPDLSGEPKRDLLCFFFHFLHFLFWGDSPLLVLLQCWRHSSFCLGLKLYIRSPKSFRADD